MQIDKCRKLVQMAEKSLKEGTNCYYAIEACNEVLDGHGHEIGSMLMHECLCIRASLLLKVWVVFKIVAFFIHLKYYSFS